MSQPKLIHTPPARQVLTDTNRGYDRWAASYDAMDNPLVAMSRIAMHSWLAQLSGRRVLELGCGTGRNAGAILAAGARSYEGLDASEGMLRVARARALDGARFHRADLGTEPPLTLAPADEVLICLVLEHFEDLRPVLQRAVSLLTPTGRVRLFELHADLRRRGTGAHFREGDTIHTLPSYPHDEAELRSALQGLGCRVDAVTDWIVTPEMLSESGKLTRHLGEKVLIEVSAGRLSSA